MTRQERKIEFLDVRCKSKVQLHLGWDEESGNLLLCSFKMEGGGKKHQKWVKSNPTRGRNQHSKAGIYSGRAFFPLWMKENHTPLQPAGHFCHVYRWNVCASLCTQQVNWKVCLSYIWSTQLHLSLAAREVVFFFPYFFIHSFAFHFSPNVSPRLPSSHPNQRTHRPLLDTPCPGNPPCTVGCLWKHKDDSLTQVKCSHNNKQ